MIWKQPTEALDLEWYRYTQNFDGLAANSDRRYGDADDLILTGFKQWDHGGRYAVQLIYAAEWAADTRLALTEGFRWGSGARCAGGRAMSSISRSAWSSSPASR